MGNTASSDKHPTGSNSPRDTTTHAPQHDSKDPNLYKKFPKRRESVPALPHGRASAVPPSASLESAQGHSSSRTPHAVSKGHTHSHSRHRSQTTVTSQSKSYDEKDGSNDRGGKVPPQEAHPVQVPTHPVPTAPNIQRSAAGQPRDSPTSPSSYHIPNSQFSRPPRLPLPIEKEDFAPGSPIISPADLPGPLGKEPLPEDGTAQLERKGSVLSSTTVDEDEVIDDFQAHGKATGQMVDTLVEWKEGGDRVYVTGSFSGWTKKHRLHRHGPSKDPNALSAIIPLLVGAHHMTFLVDGQMRTSRHLPTAVDYTNVLINYVEVSPEDIPKPSQPMDIQRPSHEQTHSKQAMALEPPRRPEGQHASALPPPTPDLKPTHKSGALSAAPSGIASPTAAHAHEQQQPQPQQPQQQTSRPTSATAHQAPHRKIIADTKPYHAEIPAFLLDLDAPEESPRFKRASHVMQTLPAPPALPMFLNKSILNGSLPMKDDASVLVLPNHTVLNHLATTSIKNHVLATSATTRYKRKYVTTIMHRPTNETGRE